MKRTPPVKVKSRQTKLVCHDFTLHWILQPFEIRKKEYGNILHQNSRHSEDIPNIVPAIPAYVKLVIAKHVEPLVKLLAEKEKELYENK